MAQRPRASTPIWPRCWATSVAYCYRKPNMSNTVEIKVPNIGDFDEVDVIEVLVAVGDRIEAEQSLITVESDKASMEIPAPQAGVVRKLAVKVGDKIAEGGVILELEPEAAASGEKDAPAAAAPAAAAGGEAGDKTAEKPAAPPATDKPPAAPAPAAASFEGKADVDCDVLVLGAGPGGYSAAFRAADLGLSVVLVERYPALGGVCLNVGCIPSKALLHTASVMDEAAALAKHGITFGKPEINLEALREFKTGVIGKLTGGLAAMAKMRKVTVLQGVGKFVGANHVRVEGNENKTV